MFSIIALEFFKLQPEQNGYLMAYFGIVQMVRLKSKMNWCILAFSSFLRFVILQTKIHL